ncbi:ARM repeat-containing protein [Backusella circina FSU 941]|nr:ARM repeat-containing protein [Backusella circina FSU 941]
MAADLKVQLLNDIKKLSLEKYISEIMGGVMEGMLKCKTSTDINACVEVVSALHQRFPDTFTLLLTYNLSKSLQVPTKAQLAALSAEQKEKEESSRIIRQRTYLRISVELWLVGVLRNVEDGISSLASTNLGGVETHRDGVAGLMGSTSASKDKKKDQTKQQEHGFVYHVLKDMLGNDEQHINLPLVASFLKNYGQLILDIVPRKQKAALEQHSEEARPIRKETAVTPDIHALLVNLFDDYYKGVEVHLVKMHKAFRKMERHNNEILFSKGDLSDETKQRFEKAQKDMPDLPEDESAAKQSIVSSGTANMFNEGKDNLGNGVWEDDDARKFYEDLPNLLVLVPEVFLESGPKKTEEETKSPTNEEEIQDETADIDEDEEENDDMGDLADDNLDNPDDDDESSAKPTQNLQLDGLLARLPNCGNRDLVDSVAVDFCFINSKNSRKRLVKTLLGVHRQRVDLLPYYSRLIATLNVYFSDIGEMVLAALTREFRGLQRKKTQDLLETRTKNIRFLSELTKFKVTPAHTIFYSFKIALDDFTNQNIDIVCNLLETCGRYLLKSPDTSARMSTMLETVMRKKTVQHLDSRYALMVENAYYQANPPDKAAIHVKERSPIELYIRKLIHVNLTKKSLDKILKQLRKLDWKNPEIFNLMVKIFQKIWKIKFGNIHLMAILASGLNRYHSDFGVQIVDGVIEEIRIGLEQNIFKHNQRRITVVKYLGELYNYRMIESPLIFDTLYSTVTFGHEFGRPARERFCSIDAPNDFFRIRLCCTLLDTCGMCFDRGSSKKKLDNFLTFFQMYVLSKLKPPMDVDFMITDTLEMLRPQLQILSSYEEANEEVDKMLLEQWKSVQGADGKVQEDGFEESEPSDSSSDDEDEDRVNINDREDEEETGDENDNQLENDADEDVVIIKKKEELSREDDEDFERELNKMMSDSADARKFEKKTTVLDVPIPMNLRGAQERRALAQSIETQDPGKMAFTLLTKKGNRQQTKIMEVPADSILAVSTRSKQEAEREEQQQLKRLVLNYEQREAAAARQAVVDERARLRANTRGKKIMQMGGGGGNAYSNTGGGGGGSGGGSAW